tara:strand:- start:119 stop:811 length:693 start_codon:yes stop_codon:yes gene_type:complete
MTTSGTATFNMDFTEIAEEAWERAGRELRSGYDLRTARRSMNLMTIEWQNRGINMWTIDNPTSINLVQGQSEYTLPADTIDLLEQQIRTNAANTSTQADLTINRISVSTYSAIPNKLTQGRPIQIYVQRLQPAPKVIVWPVPDNNNYQLNYWRMRRIEDAGSGIQTADISFRFLPCLVSGLAYHIAMKVPELVDRVQMLKAVYDEQFEMAASEDREKTPARFVPRIAGIH